MSLARSAARHTLLLSSVLALGLASAAQAQTGSAPQAAPPTTAAPPSGADTLSGVTVDANRRDPLRNIPPEKRAKWDAEVAKRNGTYNYHRSLPRLAVDSKGIADNNAMSNDFPGLRTYIPPEPGN